MRRKIIFTFGLAMILCLSMIVLAAEKAETLLLRMPAISQNRIAFVYAGDIWIVNRDGGEAKRLTVHQGEETDPKFSPDGRWIAFTGHYDGNFDVYMLSAEGGSPVRMTYHPGMDIVRGWSPDGERILFASSRYSNARSYNRLFTISRKGGFPEVLPMPMAERGDFSGDGSKITYTPLRDAFHTWKRYRGGQTTPVWLFDLKTFRKTEIPHENASDTQPVWLGDTVYFLSDRNHTMNIFGYDVPTQELRQITHHKTFDVKSLSTGDGVLVYEHAGRLKILNPAENNARELKIHVDPDLPGARPHYEKALPYIRSAAISPSGKRALFGVRGDIFTVPAKKGDIRNLTQTPGIHERFPAWSPDGKWIAYMSDESGEYRLKIRDQKGMEKPKTVILGNPTFYYTPEWSPDSKHIVFTDKRLNLWTMDIEKQKPVRIDTDTYDHPNRSLDPVWSPDSKWIAYTKRLENHLRAVFLYNLKTKKSNQITDGMSDAISACFSKDGKYLLFAASTNYGLNTGWLDMSSYERPVRRNLYLVVLNSKDPSPFAPESDEEEAEKKDSEKKEEQKKGKKDKEKDEKAEEIKVVIDLENIDQRIVSVPVPVRNYSDLQSAEEGKLFYREAVQNEEGSTLHRFDMKERKTEVFLKGIRGYRISQDGNKLLYQKGQNDYFIAETKGKIKEGDGKLKLDAMEIYVDPKQEWKQMLDEFWRIERDFFYVANMHGADWGGIRKQYGPFLEYVGHRADLNYIIAEMMGEMVVGHNYVGGGDFPDTERVTVGLLGADYAIENGLYRFKQIFSGLNWNPDLRAPLTEPGVNVLEGDYLLAVNGRPLRSPANLYSLFEKTAGKETFLTINDRPSEKGSRTVTVVPVANESGLRNRAWVEGNRRKVDAMTQGRVAYVYMPNTANAGYTYFNRYYYSQLNKEAVIVDERFNGGGSAADYIIDMMDRSLLSYWATREGKEFTTPTASIFGPKVMIINEYAGSGGDAMPLYFARRNLGKLVGKRTWGGLVGIYDYPVLMDGGRVTAPRLAIYSPEGEWEVENIGVPPDVEVEMNPEAVIKGSDPQLEKAVEIILRELKAKPVEKKKRPADPVRVLLFMEQRKCPEKSR
ncbi:PDZ domain-containing protein [bacterium]